MGQQKDIQLTPNTIKILPFFRYRCVYTAILQNSLPVIASSLLYSAKSVWQIFSAVFVYDFLIQWA